jgi:putative transposase
MSRPRRAFAEGIYHVSSHASDTRDLFLSTEDRTSFLDRFAFVLQRFDLALIAYALLSNHYHGIVFTPGGRISTALQQLHTWYSRTYNRRHERSAHLFRAHFFARDITGDDDLLTTCRYVAHNPVAAGLTDDPFAWRWSSAAASSGLVEPMIPLDPGPLRAALGDSNDWRRRYHRFIQTDEG